ncbi:hypothetical protein OROMI_023526 [Orobanche minor]
MEIGNKWLSPEMVVEILMRLSAISVLRCKSVCKLWYTLISNPFFLKTHLSLSTRNDHFVNHRLIYLSTIRGGVNLKSCSLYDVLNNNNNNSVNNSLEENYPMKSLGKSASIVGCCNGLLCIVVDEDRLFIWNPSIRVSYMLAKCDSEEAWRGWYGFGYDESSEDYKVVAIDLNVSRRGEYRNKMRMYSLKTGNWKDIDDFPHGNTGVSSCTFINGAFHWMSGQYDAIYPYRIISLDLATETYAEVLQPVYDDFEGEKFFYLGALGKWLCIVCNNMGSHADIWVMKKVYGGAKEEDSSWNKLFSITYPSDDWSFSASFPLCMSNDGKVLYKYRSKLVLYDSKNNSISEINSDDEGFIQPYTFLESLVPPTGLHLECKRSSSSLVVIYGFPFIGLSVYYYYYLCYKKHRYANYVVFQ